VSQTGLAIKYIENPCLMAQLIGSYD
jgi:hypothetical protein